MVRKTAPIVVAIGLGMATGSAGAAERFATLKPEEMTPAQKAVADKILAGPRKSMGGPFNAWLRNPELADRLQAVGEAVRFHSSLPPRINEFAILITAREWDADFEWYAHYPLALKAGLKPEVAADLAAGRRPRGMAPDEAAVYDFVRELRAKHRLSDANYAAVEKLYGERGVIDLVALSGYYDLVSMTLNTAQVKPPEPGTLPLPALKP